MMRIGDLPHEDAAPCERHLRLGGTGGQEGGWRGRRQMATFIAEKVRLA